MFIANPIKIPAKLFHWNWPTESKVYMDDKKIAKAFNNNNNNNKDSYSIYSVLNIVLST